MRARCWLGLAAALAFGWPVHTRAATGAPGVSLWATVGSESGTVATAESGAALDPEGFAAELERWSRAVARLDSSRAGVASLRDSLPAAWTIRAGDEYLDLSAGWLASALERSR